MSALKPMSTRAPSSTLESALLLRCTALEPLTETEIGFAMAEVNLREEGAIPQGLKPSFRLALMSELKLQPLVPVMRWLVDSAGGFFV